MSLPTNYNISTSSGNIKNLPCQNKADTTHVFCCEDSIDGILTAIYKAWEYGTSCTDVKIKSNLNYSLFEEYIYSDADTQLAFKVAKSIQNKLSDEVYNYVYNTCLSCYEDKTSVVYAFLRKAFKVGKNIVNYLNDETVCRIFEITRNVRNEAHHTLEFCRFEELENGVLCCRVDPMNNVVPLISAHFADRLHCENWIILDVNRKLASVHSAHHGYIITNSINESMLNDFSKPSENELEFQKLWKNFFNTIAIKERTNKDLQRNLMPLRFRHFMTAEKEN